MKIVHWLAWLALASTAAHGQLLGTASPFAVLAGTPNVSNVGPTVVTGSVGVWPALSIVGFPPGQIVPGTGSFHAGNAVAQQAQTDVTTAYNTLAGLPSVGILPALGGQVLVPGTYNAGAANLTGTLTLNGPGLYVFQTTSLTTAAGPGAAIVLLTNGATPCNVWWQVGSSATLGTFTNFSGNILALTSITLGTNASLQGRALARNGTVTLDSNNITACSGGSTPGFLVPRFFSGDSAAGTPMLSPAMLILLAGMLASAGYVVMRRRGM